MDNYLVAILQAKWPNPRSLAPEQVSSGTQEGCLKTFEPLPRIDQAQPSLHAACFAGQQ